MNRVLCRVARGEVAVDVCLPKTTKSPNNPWVPTGPFCVDIEHNPFDAKNGPHYIGIVQIR